MQHLEDLDHPLVQQRAQCALPQLHQAFVNNAHEPQQSRRSAPTEDSCRGPSSPTHPSGVVENRSLHPAGIPVVRRHVTFADLTERMQQLQAYVSMREDALNQLSDLPDDLENEEETHTRGAQATDQVVVPLNEQPPNGNAQLHQHQQIVPSNGPLQTLAFGGNATSPFQSVLEKQGPRAQRNWKDSPSHCLGVQSNPGTSQVQHQQPSVQNQWPLLNGSPQPPASAIPQLPSQLNNIGIPQLALRQQLHFRRLQQLQQLQTLSPLNASPQYLYPSSLGMARNGQSIINEPILNARQMQDLIMHAHVPVDELPSKGVPKHMITFIEGNREQFQQLATMQGKGSLRENSDNGMPAPDQVRID